jgi:hypothetical protein
VKHGQVQDLTERLGIHPGAAARGKTDKFDVHARTASMPDARLSEDA